ncbi:MAG: putative lipid II flippase FtsW [Acidaminococcaceae bacterium]|nr:putative lipid II flippase FtsW [Acidaminococcaceae bacterium]
MQKRFLFWDNPRDAVLTIVPLLMLLGAVNVFSASFVVAEAMFGSGYHYLGRYVGYGLLGLIGVYFVGWKVNYHKVLGHGQKLFFLMFFLLLAVDLFGKAAKGAQRWLVFGGFSFQPSEFVKLAVIILGARYLGNLMERKTTPHLFKLNVNMAFMEAAVLAVMVLVQPDMGTASIIMGLMIVLYIIAGLPIKEVIVLLGGCFLFAIAAIIKAPYRLNRVLIWLNPWADPQGNGYQAVQSFVSIGSGGWFGNSFGMGTGKFFFLPEAHTDFAFAIFCQEWGFLGAVGLIVMFLILAMAIFRIGQSTTSKEGFLLVAGLNFLIVGQAFANMAMVCGILPVIGVPLSFISYGGTSLLATLGAVGLVVAIYNDEVKKAKKQAASNEVPAWSNVRRPFRPGRWNK